MLFVTDIFVIMQIKMWKLCEMLQQRKIIQSATTVPEIKVVVALCLMVSYTNSPWWFLSNPFGKAVVKLPGLYELQTLWGKTVHN